MNLGAGYGVPADEFHTWFGSIEVPEEVPGEVGDRSQGFVSDKG